MVSGPSAKAIIEQAELGKSLSEMVTHFQIQERQLLRRAQFLGITAEVSAARKTAQKHQEIIAAADKYNEAQDLSQVFEKYEIKPSRRAYFSGLLTKALMQGLITPPICEVCGKKHDFSYGAGRFCSATCARGVATKNISAESREKQVAALRKASGNRKKTNKPDKKKPSKKQPTKKPKIEKTAYDLLDTRTKLSIQAQKRIANGTHVGWTSRAKRSYAEKYWEQVLTDNKVSYVTEYVVNKRLELGVLDNSNYFLDFVIESNSGAKINLEIDGKQHRYPDRVKSDTIRDDLLNKAGYFIYRIPWVNPAHDLAKVKEQIDSFLSFLDKMHTTPAKTSLIPPVTTKEELLSFAERGFTNKEITEKISLAESTLLKLLDKFDIKDNFSVKREQGKKKRVRDQAVTTYIATGSVHTTAETCGFSLVKTRKLLREAISLKELPATNCPVCGKTTNFSYGYYNLCNSECQKSFF